MTDELATATRNLARIYGPESAEEAYRNDAARTGLSVYDCWDIELVIKEWLERVRRGEIK